VELYTLERSSKTPSTLCEGSGPPRLHSDNHQSWRLGNTNDLGCLGDWANNTQDKSPVYIHC
jgi:hypothetical protein